MIKRVVIFGGHIQALGLARQVKARGIEVVIVTDDGCSVARYSRAVDRTIVAPIGDWRVKIEELGLPNKGTLLFPTNDEAVEMLCGRYEEYKKRFALGVPEPKVIELFNDIHEIKANYDQMVGDLSRINNWGMVRENGNTFMVMLDSGLSEEVYNQFYKPRWR